MIRADAKGKRLPPLPGAREKLRQALIKYFKDTPEGQGAWDRRPRITGEGVADYLTIEAMVDAVLREADV